jgi:CDGSH-type Zn-finger protein
MSIVRVGMSESKSFGDGYDAIFGKKAKKPAAPAKKPAAAKKADGKKAKKGKKA